MRGKKITEVRECVLQCVAPKPEQVTIDGLTFVIFDDKAWLWRALSFIKPEEEVIEIMRPLLEEDLQRAARLEEFRQEMMRVPAVKKTDCTLPYMQSVSGQMAAL